MQVRTLSILLAAAVSLSGQRPLEEGASTQAGSVVVANTPKPGTVKQNPDDGQPYVWIPPGEFEMGCSPGDTSCEDNERPQHTVKITKVFWLGQTEVTVGAYRQFADNTSGIEMPGEPTIGDRKLNPGWSDTGQPMVAINWQDAEAFCEDWAQGRLPSEAEWEFAARAGSTAARYGEPDAIAWSADNSGTRPLDSMRALNVQARGRDWKDWDEVERDKWRKYEEILENNGNGIRKVRQKEPNDWGLHDMLGNVWEWVADWYQEDYYQALLSPAVDPKGPNSGDRRVLRGGCWKYGPSSARVSARAWGLVEFRWYINGFRCARDTIP